MWSGVTSVPPSADLNVNVVASYGASVLPYLRCSVWQTTQ